MTSITTGTPSGSATFFDGSEQLGDPVVLNASGQAVMLVSGMKVGQHVITVEYSGDANFPGNSSAPLVHNRSPKPR